MSSKETALTKTPSNKHETKNSSLVSFTARYDVGITKLGRFVRASWLPWVIVVIYGILGGTQMILFSQGISYVTVGGVHTYVTGNAAGDTQQVWRAWLVLTLGIITSIASLIGGIYLSKVSKSFIWWQVTELSLAFVVSVLTVTWISSLRHIFFIFMAVYQFFWWSGQKQGSYATKTFLNRRINIWGKSVNAEWVILPAIVIGLGVIGSAVSYGMIAINKLFDPTWTLSQFGNGLQGYGWTDPYPISDGLSSTFDVGAFILRSFGYAEAYFVWTISTLGFIYLYLNINVWTSVFTQLFWLFSDILIILVWLQASVNTRGSILEKYDGSGEKLLIPPFKTAIKKKGRK